MSAKCAVVDKPLSLSRQPGRVSKLLCADKWILWDLCHLSEHVSIDPWRFREQPCSLWGYRCLVGACVCGLPFVHVCACALAGLLTVALQQNVCPFLSPLMWPGPAVIMSPVPRRKVNILQFAQGAARAEAQPPPHLHRTHTLCKHNSGGGDLHSADKLPLSAWVVRSLWQYFVWHGKSTSEHLTEYTVHTTWRHDWLKVYWNLCVYFPFILK